MIAVWFSSGAASAVAAWRTLERYVHDEVRVINTPIAEEDDDNRRFLEDVQQWLGVTIEEAINPDYPTSSAVEVWEKRRYMGGVAGAPCTGLLKKRARQLWEAEHKPEYTVLGFTAEEKARADRFRMTERDSLLTPLIDEGISKPECFEILIRHGIRLPEVYRQGYPNANCIGCVKATSPSYWNHVRRQHPAIFEQRAQQSRDIGARLVRVDDERIYLDELDPDAEGMPMRNMQSECGLFCEEEAA